jgi:hypothetical protein
LTDEQISCLREIRTATPSKAVPKNSTQTVGDW